MGNIETNLLTPSRCNMVEFDFSKEKTRVFHLALIWHLKCKLYCIDHSALTFLRCGMRFMTCEIAALARTDSLTQPLESVGRSGYSTISTNLISHPLWSFATMYTLYALISPPPFIILFLESYRWSICRSRFSMARTNSLGSASKGVSSFEDNGSYWSSSFCTSLAVREVRSKRSRSETPASWRL